MQLSKASRALFAPYARNRRDRRKGQPISQPVTFWSHRFCVISKCGQLDYSENMEGYYRHLCVGVGGAALVKVSPGMKIHGVLKILQKYFPDSLSFFQQSNCDGSTILTFYQPSYSDDEEKKAKDTMVVFNFGKFLKKTERGCISIVCVNPDDWTESDTVLTLEHILQAFLGSEALPTDINSGIIEFDYEMDAISKVNTCAPSITFRRIDQLQVYEEFQQHMLHIVIGSIGFGIE